MKKKNKDHGLTNGEAIFLTIYWILCGLGANIYMIHRDGSVNLAMAIYNFAFSGILTPVFGLFWIFEKLSLIRIGF